MCLLGCDAFYERGFVAVHEAGRILVSNAQSSRAVNVALQLLRGRSCSAWKASTAKYFDWASETTLPRFESTKHLEKIAEGYAEAEKVGRVVEGVGSNRQISQPADVDRATLGQRRDG